MFLHEELIGPNTVVYLTTRDNLKKTQLSLIIKTAKKQEFPIDFLKEDKVEDLKKYIEKYSGT